MHTFPRSVYSMSNVSSCFSSSSFRGCPLVSFSCSLRGGYEGSPLSYSCDCMWFWFFECCVPHIPAVSGWPGFCGPSFPEIRRFRQSTSPKRCCLAVFRNPQTTRAISKANISLSQKKKKDQQEKPSMKKIKKKNLRFCLQAKKRKEQECPFFPKKTSTYVPPIPFLNGVPVRSHGGCVLVPASPTQRAGGCARVGELSRYHGTLNHAPSDTISFNECPKSLAA